MPERLPAVSPLADVSPSAALEPASVTADAEQPAQAPPASRRAYLAGLGALTVLGTAAVVTARRLSNSAAGPATALADPATAPAGPATAPAAGTASPAMARPGSGAPTAGLPTGPAAPAVHPDAWLNTAALTPQALAGRVVLYYFWTFECINCQHVQPYIQAWHARYRDDGLVVLSIHTPEFSVEADPRNVAEYVTAHQITYPVALDPHSRVWRAFGNHYWPARYLHDQQGRRRFTQIGEGEYPETEDAIRLLLELPSGAPRATAAG